MPTAAEHSHTVLVVDDEPNYLVVISELLQDEGYTVFTADGGEKALAIIKSVDLDLVLTDMRMEGMDGLSLLHEAKAFNNHLPVIMITAFGDVEIAVSAMQAGAFTYLTKPFNNDELLVNAQKAITHYQIIKENIQLRSEMEERYGFANIIGKNPVMQHLYNLIAKVAPTTSSVLITGESGTGKELVARAVHLNSPRKDAPFISVNCAALPENLLESELFGHEKGAFTGAVGLRKGRFELANGGTLFLDEIGDMPLTLQAKLLRILQDQTFERIGGTHTLAVDVRIITATNKDLKDEVDNHNFREDLYYRLNVIHLHLPPLRERLDDIPMLVAHFLEKQKKLLGRDQLQISNDALRILTAQTWEGNVRELENTIERAAILCENNRIEPEDIQANSDLTGLGEALANQLDIDQFIPPGAILPVVLDTIEKKMLLRALNHAGMVQTKAADELGITKSLLQYKMKKYGLHRLKSS